MRRTVVAMMMRANASAQRGHTWFLGAYFFQEAIAGVVFIAASQTAVDG